jgi:hypothetical protein
MTAAAGLPPGVRNQLAALARRVRRLRLVRGLSGLSLAVVLPFGAALLADAWLCLGQAALAVILAGVGAAAVLALLFGLILPLCRPPSAAALAALVEKHYPHLGERLTSAVELADTGKAAHGSPALIALLLEETEVRTRPLALAQVFPGRPAAVRCGAALTGLSLVLLPAFVWTDHYASFADRLLSAWHVPADDDALSSPAGLVPAVEPVTLIPGSLTATITPPPYVKRTVHPEQALQSFSQLSVLEYSQVRLACRFTRPANSARLEVTLRGPRDKPARTWLLPLALLGGGAEAAVQLPALAIGKHDLSLHIQDEHQVVSTHTLAVLEVWGDAPPEFTIWPRLVGAASSGGLDVSPSEIVELRVGARDRVGLDRALVEYRLNDGPTRNETIFKAEGAASATVDHPFDLAGRVKDGDVVRLRVSVADNRRLAARSSIDPDGQAVPVHELAPHVIYFPERKGGEDRWLTLKVSATAGPLRQREILAERDEVARRLQAVRKRLVSERSQLAGLRQASKDQPGLTAANAWKLEEVLKENTGVLADLFALAREAAKVAALQDLAELAQEVAEGEMVRSDEALKQAQDRQTDATAREEHLDRADQELAAALRRLDDLGQLNDRLARDRVDHAELERLAQRQERLGKQPLDSHDKDELEQVRATQDKLIAELDRLAQESQLFREALEAARSDQARRLAEKARELAAKQRALAQAKDEVRDKVSQGVLGNFTRRQEKLAAEAEWLAQQTAGAEFQADDVKAAAEALKKGQVEQALRLQEQAARELERASEGQDPRVLARKLAAAQENLMKRLMAEAGNLAVKPPQQVLQYLNDLRGEEEALGKAAAALPAQGQEAARHAADAARALKRGDPFQAHEQMRQARQALERLAGQAKPPDPIRDPARDKEQQNRAQEARRLAKDQKELRAALQKALADPPVAQGSPKDGPPNNLATRQQDLIQETTDLTKELAKMAQSSKAPSQAKAAARQAAAATEKARDAMQKAKAAAGKGDPAQVRQAQAQAALMLDLAGKQAEQAGAKGTASTGASRQMGHALQDGQEKAGHAQAQLRQGQPAARAAMQQAGQALRQASQQAARQLTGQGQAPGLSGPMHTRSPADPVKGKMGRVFGGSSWGQLPGELRTRVLQDLRARFGEDYAGIIQHYFEDIADTGR